jgi:palmitoyltransferase
MSEAKKSKSKNKSHSKSKSKSKNTSEDKKAKKKTSKVSNKSKDKKKKDASQDMSDSKLNKNNTNPNLIDIQNNINNLSNINPQYNSQRYPPIKCDGCYEGDAICFCVQCGQYYCKICDDQIHLVPANSLHQKKPINFVNSYQKTCYLHKGQPLKLFCESCEEPICHECQMIGPHNNKLHKIVNIIDSYRKKLNYMNLIKNKSMNNKYNQLMNQIQYLDNFSKQIKDVKNNIEKNIRKEYDQMIDNLNSFEGKKMAIINYESSNLQKNLNDISEIINYLNQIILSDKPDMIDFLLKYKQINEKVEDILAKPIKTKYNIITDDFPHELEENNKKIKNCDNMEQLCQLKDEIIWKLMTDTETNINIKEINEKSKLEIEKWAKLSEKYVSELRKYNLICKFCGCALDENTVNTSCEKNYNIEGQELINSKIPEGIIGSKRHYFVPLKK